MGTIAQAEAGLLAAVTPVLLMHEEEQFHVYDDIYGNPTIGVGFLMTRPDAPALCQQCGADYQRLLGAWTFSRRRNRGGYSGSARSR